MQKDLPEMRVLEFVKILKYVDLPVSLPMAKEETGNISHIDVI